MRKRDVVNSGWTMRKLVGVVTLALTVFSTVGPSEAIILTPGSIVVTDQTLPELVLQVNPNDGSTLIVSVYPNTNLPRPVGIAVAADGDLLVADARGALIQVNPAGLPDANQTIVSSGGNFVSPQGVAVAPNGDVFVVDNACCSGGQGGVIQVNPADGSQTLVSEGQNFGSPLGIAIGGNGDLFVVCCGGVQGREAAVIQVNPAQPPDANQTIVSSGQNFKTPVGIAVGAQGILYVADANCCGGLGAIIQVNPTLPSTFNQTIIAFASSPGNLIIVPSGIATAANGDLLVIAGAGVNGFQIIQVNPVDPTQTLVAAQDDWFPAGIAVVPDPSRPLSACGGTVPCACGDLVLRDRTLRGSDPVTRTTCPADGLVVADGVTLDLGGATLRGQGAGAGVRIEAGATNATVRRGKITGFATGVRGQGTGTRLTSLQIFDHAGDGVILTGDGHRVEQSLIQGNGGLGVVVLGDASRLVNLHVRNNARAGVRVVGNGNRLEQSAIEGNGEHGAEVSGDLNQVAFLRVQGNRGDGVFLMGTGNTAARNSALGNGADGLEIRGASATLDRNRATSNGEAGLKIHGTGHAVTQNIAGLNAGTGLEMVGTTESRFDRNRGENNRGFGIADDSTGGGTRGTANIYTNNRCGRGNGVGPSSPVGLCR